MSKILVKNFGAIKEGYDQNNGFIDLQKVTVFIGDQGTGKSSVAKLISTCSWIEKNIFQARLSIKEATNYNRFVNTYCAYQNIKNYFLPDTEISYLGDAYHIHYKSGKLSIQEHNITSSFVVPKIMYIPAERNFLSAVKSRSVQKLKELPASLFTFWEELEKAQQNLAHEVQLPIGDVHFEFDKLNETANIVGKGYKIKLSEASSGYQSAVPLFLVSSYLNQSVQNIEATNNMLTALQRKELEKQAENIMSNTGLSYDVKMAALKALSSKFRNGCFVNIVEELEQNLFPFSQKQILFKLLEYVNQIEQNKLIITTHSPYIINYLNLAIKCFELQQKIGEKQDLLNSLNKIVPLQAGISNEKTAIYELTNGNITSLSSMYGLPSDDNLLNNSLAEGNTIFNQLLDIEDAL